MTIETFKKAENIVSRIESLEQNIENLQGMLDREDKPYEINFKFDGSKGKENEYRTDYFIQGPRADNQITEVPKAIEFREFIHVLLENYEIRLHHAKEDLEQI